MHIKQGWLTRPEETPARKQKVRPRAQLRDGERTMIEAELEAFVIVVSQDAAAGPGHGRRYRPLR
jgi:hypothetical protein